MLNLFRRWYERHFSQPGTIEFALVLICSFLIVYYLMWLVGPMVVALCIAFCLDWPVQALQKYLNMGRHLASSVIMILFCSIVILITVLIVPQFVKQGAEFYNSIIAFSLETANGNNPQASDPKNKANSSVEQTSPVLPQDGSHPAGATSTIGAANLNSSPVLAPDLQAQIQAYPQPQAQTHNDKSGNLADTHTLSETGNFPAASSTTLASTAASTDNHSLQLAASKFSSTNATINDTSLTVELQTTSQAAQTSKKTQEAELTDANSYYMDESYAGGNKPADTDPQIDPTTIDSEQQILPVLTDKITSAQLLASTDPSLAQSNENPAAPTANAQEADSKDKVQSVKPGSLAPFVAQDVDQTKAQVRPLVINTSAALADLQYTPRRNEDEDLQEFTYKEATHLYTLDRVPNPAKLINLALPESMRLPDGFESENTFKLTVYDFDTRLAHEAYLLVHRLPDPLPSMLSIDVIKNAVRQVRIQTTAYLADLMRTQLMPSVVNLFTWAVYLIIVPIFTFLMLYNKEELKKRATLFILPNNQVLMRKFWPSLHQQIAGYIRGKLIHIIIISIANSIAFKLLNVNYALLLGVGVGLSVVIPYVGAVIIAIPVVLVAIFQFGFSESLIWVLVIYTIIQLLDSNVLTPMLFSKAMNLDAFSILAAILIFGGLWGFWGVFFAIPLATFIKTIVMQWPNKDVREQQKREHLRLIQEQKAEQAKKANQSRI